jgi:hypothetical protein
LSDYSPKNGLSDDEVKKASARRTRRSFLVAGLGAIGGYEFYQWIAKAKANEMLPEPLRAALNWNAKVAHGVFDERGLAPTYPASKSRELRVNGNYGLKQDLVPESYRLQVVGVEGAERMPQYVKDVTAWEYKYKAADGEYQGHDTKVNPKDEAKAAGAGTDPKIAALFANAPEGADDNNDGRPPRGLEEAGESDSTLDPGTPGLLLTMGDVTKLGHRELVTQFKCIEGWSEIVHWAGVPLRDFIAAYPPAKNAQGELPKYVYMETPNGDYYCGFHLQDCLHPQSTLVTEMAGQPLGQWHGAPMRLHMPIKYGYKQIKRIGLIAYTDDKPDDYWTKLGYDWYAGI